MEVVSDIPRRGVEGRGGMFLRSERGWLSQPQRRTIADGRLGSSGRCVGLGLILQFLCVRGIKGGESEQSLTSCD
jgi:hypothetical protein